jgi:hypothetical protein
LDRQQGRLARWEPGEFVKRRIFFGQLRYRFAAPHAIDDRRLQYVLERDGFVDGPLIFFVPFVLLCAFYGMDPKLHSEFIGPD